MVPVCALSLARGSAPLRRLRTATQRIHVDLPLALHLAAHAVPPCRGQLLPQLVEHPAGRPQCARAHGGGGGRRVEGPAPASAVARPAAPRARPAAPRPSCRACTMPSTYGVPAPPPVPPRSLCLRLRLRVRACGSAAPSAQTPAALRRAPCAVVALRFVMPPVPVAELEPRAPKRMQPRPQRARVLAEGRLEPEARVPGRGCRRRPRRRAAAPAAPATHPIAAFLIKRSLRAFP